MAGSGARQNFGSKKRGPKRKSEAFNSGVEGSQTPVVEQRRSESRIKPVSIEPKNEGQQILKETFEQDRLAFVSGPAGTGKTLFAISRAVDLLLTGDVRKILLARPAVEAGERLGFLPGAIREKLDPYLLPLLDELEFKIGGGAAAKKQIEKWFTEGALEVVPIGMMRGRTFRHAAIVIDEVQNCTYKQLKMITTRLGEGSHMFLTGDETQCDLPDPSTSGMEEFFSKFYDNGYPVVYLEPHDVVRDPLVADMLRFL
jgi:phosphate starvation-inducible PhoH-like protein